MKEESKKDPCNWIQAQFYQALEETPIMIGINSTVLFLCLASILDSTLDHRIILLRLPNFGIGLLIGYNGFLAVKLGIHLRRTFGLAILIPIVPIYGATERVFQLYCLFQKEQKLQQLFHLCQCQQLLHTRKRLKNYAGLEQKL